MARLPPPTSVPAPLAGYGLLAHSPDVLRTFLGLYGRLWRDGIIDQATKEVVRLRNARLTGCGYCRSVRFAGAREEGLAETDVAMIDDAYATSALSQRRKAAVALTDVVLGRTEAVDDALAAALARELTPAQIVELAVTAGLCHGFSKIAVAFGPPPDMPVMIVPSPTPPD